MFLTKYLLLIINCYLIGSIPTAYIVLKRMHNKNITEEGTGNVGAMNIYDVSGSKITGIIVFIIDFLKGLIPVFILAYVIRLPIEFIVIPAAALVAGHNFSVWLKFKGGRGLATAAGVMIIINFWLFIIWCGIFLLTFFIKKNVHISNVLATVFLPLLIIFSGGFLIRYNYGIGNENLEILFTLTSLISLLILIKHIEPVINFFKEYKKK